MKSEIVQACYKKCFINGAKTQVQQKQHFKKGRDQLVPLI